MANTQVPTIDPQIEQLCDGFRRDYRAVQAEIGKAIVGHEEIVDGVLTACSSAAMRCWKACPAWARPR